MAQLSVTIHGRNYPIVCDDGQEEHVTRLAAYIDKRATEIAETVGQVGDGRLLVMTSLLVADELSEAYDEMERLQVAAKTPKTQFAAKRARPWKQKSRRLLILWLSASKILPPAWRATKFRVGGCCGA